MPGQVRYQDKAREFINNISRPIKMEPAQPKVTSPAVAREATRQETRFLLSIIANNVRGLQEGFTWHAAAIQAALKAPSATLAMQTFSDLKASLAVPLCEEDLKEATLGELDRMISSTQQKMTDLKMKLGKMIKEMELKRAMREEQRTLEAEERVLREKRESLRERTLEGLKRKRGIEGQKIGKGSGKEDGEDVKVKKEKLDEDFWQAEKKKKLDDEDEVAQKNDTTLNKVAVEDDENIGRG